MNNDDYHKWLASKDYQEFRNNPPSECFFYLSTDKKQAQDYTGNILGNIVKTKEVQSMFGGFMTEIHVLAINNRYYRGTYTPGTDRHIFMHLLTDNSCFGDNVFMLEPKKKDKK